MRRRIASLASCFVLAPVLVASPACNRRVFLHVENTCDSTIPVDLEIPAQRAADILIVVDNSGSMKEEQDNLVANFVNENRDECPLQELDAIPDEFRNPAREIYSAGGPLADCGFVQLLAAFDNDFRVGVITTDVGMCDNRFGDFGDDFRPQRGCLQPDGPTRTAQNLVLERADIERAKRENNPVLKDFAGRFKATLDHIGTSGSGFERGLDAVEIFLDGSSARGPGCEDDLARFRRPGAELVVILLTDEEDCSHADGAYGFLDENQFGTDAQLVCGANERDDVVQNVYRCYDSDAALAPMSRYVDAVRRADPRAKVALIAGLVRDPDAAEGFSASGCLAPPPGTDGPPSTACFESHGSSIDTRSNGICGAETAPDRDGQACCVADPGSRYLDFASAFQSGNQKSFLLDSICSNSFRSTMIQIAEFIAATSFVDLVEPPVDGLVAVSLVRDGEERVVERIPASACDSHSGWFLDGPQRVSFCGDAIPRPGDQLQIRAKGRSESPDCLARAAEEEAAH